MLIMIEVMIMLELLHQIVEAAEVLRRRIEVHHQAEVRLQVEVLETNY